MGGGHVANDLITAGGQLHAGIGHRERVSEELGGVEALERASVVHRDGDTSAVDAAGVAGVPDNAVGRGRGRLFWIRVAALGLTKIGHLIDVWTRRTAMRLLLHARLSPLVRRSSVG